MAEANPAYHKPPILAETVEQAYARLQELKRRRPKATKQEILEAKTVLYRAQAEMKRRFVAGRSAA
jgi:hypothetical protein